MKILLKRSFILVVAIFLSGPALAAPCELTKNKFGSWISDCKLENVLGETIKLQLIETPPIPIALPDLYPDDADFTVFGTTIEIEARTGNQGQARTGDYDITAEVTISGNGMVPQTVLISNRAPGIDIGLRQDTFIGTVQVPDRIYDYDIHTVLYADSNDFANGGEIRELNEMNNRFDDGVCRVYGENPDLSVGACR